MATDAKGPDVRSAGFAGMGLLLLAKRAAVLTAVALLLIACGEGGAPSLPSGTSSRSAGELPSLTATVPDLTRSPTRPESPTQTAEPPSTTRSATRPERPAQTVTTTEPPNRPSAESALAAPTPLSPPSPSTSPSPSSRRRRRLRGQPRTPAMPPGGRGGSSRPSLSRSPWRSRFCCGHDGAGRGGQIWQQRRAKSRGSPVSWSPSCGWRNR